MNEQQPVDQYTVADLEPYLPESQATRLINLLDNRGIVYLRDLISREPEELTKMHSIGTTGARQLMDAVKTHRRKFKW